MSTRHRRIPVHIHPVPVVRELPSELAVHVYTLPLVQELPLNLADATHDATW
jgi:hypothetical protein